MNSKQKTEVFAEAVSWAGMPPYEKLWGASFPS